ncbi:MAG: hypothetical protein LM567_02680 [Desulfurococcaceae archaeon]|jgi:hypothetical protein|nr:hypothetical protein [Desulfurococcaceae archaeon]
MSEVGLIEAIEVLLSSKPLLVLILQFILGVGLGYVSVKAFKYVLAFIILLLLGALLSLWSLSEQAHALMSELGDIARRLIGLLIALGILTVGPLSIGFLIGALLALVKK